MDNLNIFTVAEDPQELLGELHGYADINRFNLLNRGFLARNHDRLSEGGPMAISGPMGDTTSSPASFGNRALWNDPPWVEPPPGYIDFDPRATLPLPAVAVPPPETEVLVLLVPTGLDGVIKWYSNNFEGGGFVNGSGDIVWRIRINGRAVRNFDNILFESGTVEKPRRLAAGIRIYSGQRVTYTVQHVANPLLGVEPIVCSFVGYFYPALGS